MGSRERRSGIERLEGTKSPLTVNMLYSIGAGEEIIIPITVMNRDKEIWGEDADELRYVSESLGAPLEVTRCELGLKSHLTC